MDAHHRNHNFRFDVLAPSLAICFIFSSLFASTKTFAQGLEVDAPPSTFEAITPMNEPTTPVAPEIATPESSPPEQIAPQPDIFESDPISPSQQIPPENIVDAPTQLSAPPQLKTGKQMIEHPWAEKGLIKIDKKGVYRYTVAASPIDAAFSVRVGMFDPLKLENPDADIPFGQIYDPTEGPLILGDYELRFLKSFGKMAFKLGGGLFVTSGKGVFEETGAQALESFSFFAVPLTVGLVYRLQFWDKQPLVPYAEGGGMGIPFFELRDDGAFPKLGASYGFYFAGGAQIDMGLFGTEEMLDLDREYGINRLWLQVELRSQVNLGKYDFSGNVINAGFLFEY